MMNKYKLNLNDIEFIAFKKGSGSGGQNKNKVSTSIRATHLPTGVRVEASKERSLTANKKAAVEDLQSKLDKMLSDEIAKDQQEKYNSKVESSFGSQIRTYRLCGNEQTVVDHRTGVSGPTRNVLNGHIDEFIFGGLKYEK